MKRILLVWLLISPLCSFAINTDSTSKWEAGIAIGLSNNSVHSNWEGHSFKHTMNFASQISIMRNLGKHFQVGAEVCPTLISYKESIYGLVMQSGTGITTMYGPVDHKVVIANPALPVCLAGNYRYDIGNVRFYAGLAAGFVTTMINKANDKTAYDRSKSGITYGGQIGLQDRLTTHLSLYVEADIRNLTLHETAVYYSYLPSPLYYYCGLVGLRYGF